jgi:hypothetical protein
MPKFVIVRICKYALLLGAQRLTCILLGNRNDEDVRSIQAASGRCEAKVGMI